LDEEKSIFVAKACDCLIECPTQRAFSEAMVWLNG